MELKEGQTLWFVPYYVYEGEPREITVDTVGEEWAYSTELPGMKIHKKTLRVHEFERKLIGRQCYLSEKDYLKKLGVREKWAKFTTRINGMSITAIEEMAPKKIDRASKILWGNQYEAV
jgi:hypothetical protein